MLNYLLNWSVLLNLIVSHYIINYSINIQRNRIIKTSMNIQNISNANCNQTNNHLFIINNNIFIIENYH